MSDAAAEVLAAAQARSRALAARDADALRALLHPDLVWASPRGDVLTRDAYVDVNVGGAVVWHDQRLEEASVVVQGDTAIVVCDAVDDVERDGVRGTHRFRVTFTWVRGGDGAWTLLAGAVGPKLG